MNKFERAYLRIITEDIYVEKDFEDIEHGTDKGSKIFEYPIYNGFDTVEKKAIVHIYEQDGLLGYVVSWGEGDNNTAEVQVPFIVRDFQFKTEKELLKSYNSDISKYINENFAAEEEEEDNGYIDPEYFEATKRKSKDGNWDFDLEWGKRKGHWRWPNDTDAYMGKAIRHRDGTYDWRKWEDGVTPELIKEYESIYGKIKKPTKKSKKKITK